MAETKKYVDSLGVLKLHELIGGEFVAKESGKRLMTDAEGTKLAGIESGAQVNIIETVKVNHEALEVTGKAVDIIIPDAAEYSIAKKAESGDYAAVYQLTKDGTPVGSDINIPKDMVVRKAGYVNYNGTDTSITVEGEEVAVKGTHAKGKYVVMLIQNDDESQVWLNAKDLISVTDDTTIHYNSDGKLEVIFGGAGAASDASLREEVARAKAVEGNLEDLDVSIRSTSLVGSIINLRGEMIDNELVTSTAINQLKQKVGNLSDLDTSVKTDLVSAINEVNEKSIAGNTTVAEGDGIAVDSSIRTDGKTYTVSVKKDSTSESYLTVSANGLKVSGIDAAIDEATAAMTDEEIEAAWNGQ